VKLKTVETEAALRLNKIKLNVVLGIYEKALKKEHNCHVP